MAWVYRDGAMRWDHTSKHCGNCRFWPLSSWSQTRWDNGEGNGMPSGEAGYNGLCHRHAPVAVSGIEPFGSGYRVGDTRFPETGPENWCGDFEPREGYDKHAAASSNHFSRATKAVATDWRAERPQAKQREGSGDG
jgi:hypothetical protein